MPFYRKISGNGYDIGLWKMEEPSEVLYDKTVLSDSDKVRYATFGNERRKSEFLAVRNILLHLAGQNVEVDYNKHGKPFLAGHNKFISISHSQDFAAVILSDVDMGIDVESVSRKIERIAARFLSTQELEWINDLTDSHLTKIIAWCAKEAIYKMMGQTDVEFREQIAIQAFNPANDSTFDAWFTHPTKNANIRANFERVENNVVVWCAQKSCEVFLNR